MESLTRNIKISSTCGGVDLLHMDRDLAIGARNNVYILMWRDRTTVEGATLLARSLREYSLNRPKELVLITIIEPRAKMPAPGSREILARILNDVSPTVLISGVAFEGAGFMAAGIRSVVVGLTLLARQAFPHRVFKSVAEVTAWIEAEHLRIGQYFKASELQAITSTFRRLVPPGSIRPSYEALRYG